MTSGRIPQGGCYIGKVETLALLIHGGLKDSELLTLPDTSLEDIEAAKDLLKRAFSGKELYWPARDPSKRVGMKILKGTNQR